MPPPSPFAAPEDADGRVSAHPQSHDDFLAKIQTSTRVLIPSPSDRARDSYASDSTYATGTPAMSQPFHLPSRSIASPVPIDNFAAPRSDSPYGLHRRNQSSGQHAVPAVSDVRVSEQGDSRSMTGESRHRFTIGDTYEYNEYDEPSGRRRPPQMSEKKASGWEDEGGRRTRNKRFLWCLVVLVIIAVAVGVGVGMSSKNKSGDAEDDGAPSDAASTGTTDSVVDASEDAPTSVSTADPTAPTATALVTATLTSPLLSSTTRSGSSSRPANALSAVAGALQATPVPQTLVYAYEVSGVTTSAPVVYTIPPAGVQTRANGQWQFTEDVVLPYPVGVGTGSFTSSLRFRIDPTTTAVSRRRSLPIR